MFITLTDAKRGMPVLVNLDQLLYAYRDHDAELTMLVFGKLVAPAGGRGAAKARVRSVALRVEEDLEQIHEKRRMGG
ncbi:MAG: hypothetical protein PVJ27_05470 [Candidatus Brocadiaceae bacterium]|jgi:hypothetical protein